MGIIADRLIAKIQGLKKGLENDAKDLRDLAESVKQSRKELKNLD
jgi:hypothetical protein